MIASLVSNRKALRAIGENPEFKTIIEDKKT